MEQFFKSYAHGVELWNAIEARGITHFANALWWLFLKFQNWKRRWSIEKNLFFTSVYSFMKMFVLKPPLKQLPSLLKCWGSTRQVAHFQDSFLDLYSANSIQVSQ